MSTSLSPGQTLPAEITPGELAAIAAANSDGWIVPPVYDSLARPQRRGWSAAHLGYLHLRGLVAERRRRVDAQINYRLNAAGMELRP